MALLTYLDTMMIIELMYSWLESYDGSNNIGES